MDFQSREDLIKINKLKTLYKGYSLWLARNWERNFFIGELNLYRLIFLNLGELVSVFLIHDESQETEKRAKIDWFWIL